ncbi:MAG: hypothetical protein M3Q73_01945 [bacterium]|nr:hypothetical protein [bacterium]
MTTIDQIITRIIKEQELIIGPIAWREASKVSGLHIVDQKKGEVYVENQETAPVVVDNLVSQYEHLFGRASREVCKEAASKLIGDLDPNQIPSSLR